MIKASVVIPVYNEAIELEKTLRALQGQTYPQEQFEVIVVDNGSTDHTRELVEDFCVTYLLQDEYLNSSYSSRNRGIERAEGEVVALLDGTVIPEKEWLEEALNCMEARQADIVTSNVRFDFDGKVTAGKLYDTNNATTERQVRERKVAVTASLFVKAFLFKKLGMFKEGAKTAEDVIWTLNATQMGYKLEYCKKSIAYKKAKTFKQLLKKQWREGKGYPEFWKKQDKNINVYKKLFRSLLPYHPKKINKLLQNVDFEVGLFHKIKLYFVAWAVFIVLTLGYVYGSHNMKYN